VLSLGHSFFAQAKKGDSLAAASETKDERQAIPLAFVHACIQIDTKQVLARGSGWHRNSEPA
jgi:hypothetical protein